MSSKPVLALLAAAMFCEAGTAFAVPFAVPASHNNVAAIAMGYSCVADGTLYYSADCNPALYRLSPGKYEVGLGLGLSPELITALLYLKKHGKDISNIYKNLKNGLDSSDAAKIEAARGDIKKLLKAAADKPFGLNLQPYTGLRFSDNFGVSFYNNTNVFIQVNEGQLVGSIISLPTQIDMNDPVTKSIVTNAVNELKDHLSAALNDLGIASSDIQQLLDGNIDLETLLNKLPPIEMSDAKKYLAYSLYDYLPSVEAIAYSDTVLEGTYATEPLENLPHLTMGANLRIVNRRITIQALSPLDINSQTTKDILKEIKKSSIRLGTDLGFTYSWNRPYNLRAGLMLQEILHGQGTIKSDEDSLLSNFSPTDPAPFIINTGVSWAPSEKWRINLDLYDTFNKTILYEGENYFSHVNTGAQYMLLPWLGLRGGFNYRLPTSGFGLVFRHFNFDYAIAPNIFGIYSHFIQFRLLFGKGGDRYEDLEKSYSHNTPGDVNHAATGNIPQSDSAPLSMTTAEPAPQETPAESIILPQATSNTESYSECLENADNYIGMKNFSGAAQELKKAQKTLSADDKRRIYTYEQQGQVFLKLKDLRKARDAYLAALLTAKRLKVKDGTVVNAYLGLAYCFEKTGNIQSAINNYEKAMSLTTNKQTKIRIAQNLRKLKARAR